MTESTTSVSLRSVFLQKAEWPQKQVSDAENFISMLEQAHKAPSADDIRQGRALLDGIRSGTEDFSFHAAVLAGQDSHSEQELEQKLQKIATGLEQANKIAAKLKEFVGSSAI